jgi:Nif-specific regulatory protein
MMEACASYPVTTDRHAQELAVLGSISRLLASRGGQRELLSAVLEELEQKLGMIRGTVMLRSPDGDELSVEVARNLPPGQHRELRYRRGEGIVGAVLQSGQPALVPRVSKEPRFTNRIHQRPEEADDFSFLCVPIVLEKEIVGTLSVDLPVGQPEVLRERSRLLEIVAAMIAFDVHARRVETARQQTLQAENLRLRRDLEERCRPENILGNSHAMRDVYLRIRQVAPTQTTVLLRGESGTGKELVATAIHYSSPRAAHPLVKVNCAAGSENLLESELFGCQQGDPPGGCPGRIEEARGGTLFLDEIGAFSPALQVKLLRLLQEREFERLGSNQTLEADVRVIVATKGDLEARVAAGTLRQDLYYRIHVFPITLPPLRERRDDILLLADHLAAKYGKKLGKEIRRISTPAINMMLAYHWPGNVRELENCLEHAVLLASDGVIHGHTLPPSLQLPEAGGAATGSLRARVEVLERDMLMDALKTTRGNVAAAARALGITPRMVRYKLRKLQIDYPRFFRQPSPGVRRGDG